MRIKRFNTDEVLRALPCAQHEIAIRTGLAERPVGWGEGTNGLICGIREAPLSEVSRDTPRTNSEQSPQREQRVPEECSRLWGSHALPSMCVPSTQQMWH